MAMERPRTPEAARSSLALPSSAETFDFKYSNSNGLLDLDDNPELCFNETPATLCDIVTTPGFSPLDASLLTVRGHDQTPSKPRKADGSERAHRVADLSISDVPITTQDHEHIETTGVGSNRILWRGTKIFSDSTEVVSTTQDKTRGPDLILDSNKVDYKFIKGPSKDRVNERNFPKSRRSSATTISRLRSLISTASPGDYPERHDGKMTPVCDTNRHPDQRSDTDKVVKIQVNTASISILQEEQVHSTVETATSFVMDIGQVVDSAKMNKTLVRIMPYDAIWRLQENPELCVSCTATSSTTRCRNFTYWTDDAVKRIAAEAARLQVPYTVGNAAPLLREVIGTATCTRGKHRAIAKSQLEELERVFRGDKERTDSHWPSTKRVSSADMKAVPGWLARLLQPFVAATAHRTAQSTSITAVSKTVLSGKAEDFTACGSRHDTQVITTLTTTLTQKSADAPHLVPQPEHADEAELPPTNSLSSTATTTTTLIATSATIGQSFIPKPLPVWGRYLTTHQAIRDQLLLELTPKEQGPGFIYMYWNPPNLGHIKIGVTQTNISRRLGQWRRQCGHEAQSHEVLGQEDENDEDATTKPKAELQIPHVYRVEHLVHTELRNSRLIEQRCEKCGKKHIEWFGVDAGHARAVIHKWARWMKTRRPFEAPDAIGDNSLKPTPTPIAATVAPPTTDTTQSEPKSKSRPRRGPSREARRIPFTAAADTLYLPGRLTRDEIEEICEPLTPAPPLSLASADRRKTRPRLSQTRTTRTRVRRSIPVKTGDTGGVELTFPAAAREGGGVETKSKESRVMQRLDEVGGEGESEGKCLITANVTTTAVVTEERIVVQRIKAEDEEDEKKDGVQVSTRELVTVMVDELRVAVKDPAICS